LGDICVKSPPAKLREGNLGDNLFLVVKSPPAKLQEGNLGEIVCLFVFLVVKTPPAKLREGNLREIVCLFVFFGCKIPSRNFAGGEFGEQEFMIMSVEMTCGIVLVVAYGLSVAPEAKLPIAQGFAGKQDLNETRIVAKREVAGAFQSPQLVSSSCPRNNVCFAYPSAAHGIL
jgi:hypothetical protein